MAHDNKHKQHGGSFNQKQHENKKGATGEHGSQKHGSAKEHEKGHFGNKENEKNKNVNGCCKDEE